MRWVSCMAAIAALAFAAPAAAVTMVFDINVTSAQGVPDFTPFSFQQTWTFGPGAVTTIFNAPKFARSLDGPASAGPSPDGFDASAHALAALGVLSSSGAYDFTSGGDASTFTTFASLQAVEQTRLVIGSITSFRIERYQSTTLDAANSGPFSANWLYPVSEAGLAAYVAAAGPIAWRDEAGERVSTVSGAVIDLQRRVYAGTATLAPPPPPPPPAPGAVPEPSTWAVMILGFGGVGAALRRAPRMRRPILACA